MLEGEIDENEIDEDDEDMSKRKNNFKTIKKFDECLRLYVKIAEKLQMARNNGK